MKGEHHSTLSIPIYQLVKLCMLEFYYDCLDKNLYIAISGTLIDKVVRSELREEYNNGRKAEFLLTSNYHGRTLGLFKAEFESTRMITLTSKCYYTKDDKSQSKFSCNGVSKKQNPLSWE